MNLIRLSLFSCLLTSCALITTPVKVVGKAATTTIGLTGKAAGAGLDALRSNAPSESH